MDSEQLTSALEGAAAPPWREDERTIGTGRRRYRVVLVDRTESLVLADGCQVKDGVLYFLTVIGTVPVAIGSGTVKMSERKTEVFYAAGSWREVIPMGGPLP